MLKIILTLLSFIAFTRGINNGEVKGSVNEFPSYFAIFVGETMKCGAVVISRKFALTIAHCVWEEKINPSNVKLRGPTVDISNGGGEESKVTEIKVHESFDSENWVNDIALLKVDLSPNVGDSAILKFQCPESSSSVGTVAVAAGCGSSRDTKLLKTGTVAIIPNTECIKAYENQNSIYSKAPPISDDMVCGKFELATNVQESTCVTDNGGPLINPENQCVIGLIMLDYLCSKDMEHSYPGIFLRLSKYQTWILDRTEGTLNQ